MPTIEQRLQQQIILMSTDTGFISSANNMLPPGWALKVVTDLYDIGDWSDVLLYRFLILDLNEIEAFDPLDVIRMIRMQFQINIPVFCFGGDEDLQEEMRLSRADRFFTRETMLEMLPMFFRQYQTS